MLACLANFPGKSFLIFTQPCSSLNLCSLPSSPIFQLCRKLLCKKSHFAFGVQVENGSSDWTKKGTLHFLLPECAKESPEGLLKLNSVFSTPQSFWSGRSRVGSENLCFCQFLKWGWCHLFKDHIWRTTLPEKNSKNGRNASSFSLSYSFPCCQWLCVEWCRKKELINTCDSAFCEISLSTWPSLTVGILDPEALQGQGPRLALNIYLRLWF